jgi:hypothetical protein
VISLLIQNYLNSIVKQQTTQVSQKGSIDIQSFNSIFIIHSFSILMAIFTQALTSFMSKSVTFQKYKIKFFHFINKRKLFKIQKHPRNNKENPLEVIDLDGDNGVVRF